MEVLNLILWRTILMGAQEVNVPLAITFLQEVSEIGNAFGARIVCDVWTSKERFAF